MTIKHLIQDYQYRARAERKDGTKIEINYGIPYISIENPNGNSWFFQEHEAAKLIAEAEKAIKECFDGLLSVEDYILAVSQDW